MFGRALKKICLAALLVCALSVVTDAEDIPDADNETEASETTEQTDVAKEAEATKSEDTAQPVTYPDIAQSLAAIDAGIKEIANVLKISNNDDFGKELMKTISQFASSFGFAPIPDDTDNQVTFNFAEEFGDETSIEPSPEATEKENKNELEEITSTEIPSAENKIETVVAPTEDPLLTTPADVANATTNPVNLQQIHEDIFDLIDAVKTYHTSGALKEISEELRNLRGALLKSNATHETAEPVDNADILDLEKNDTSIENALSESPPILDTTTETIVTEKLSPSASFNFSNADIRVLVDEVRVLQNILRNFTEASNPSLIHDDIKTIKELLKDFTETGLQAVVHKEVTDLESVFKNLKNSDIVSLVDKVESLETVVNNSSNSDLKTTIHDEITGLINLLKSLEDSDTHSLVRELGELQSIIKKSSSSDLRKVLEKELRELDETLKNISNAEPVKEKEEDKNLDINSEIVDREQDTDLGIPPSVEEKPNPEEDVLDSIAREVLNTLNSLIENRTLSNRYSFPTAIPPYHKPDLKKSNKPVSQPIPGPAVLREPPIPLPSHTPTPPIQTDPVGPRPEHRPQSQLPSERYSDGNEYFRTIGDNGYDFGYLVESPEKNTQYERHETRTNNGVTGGYSVLLPDGRLQTVEYTADERGYRPTIRYSKPS